MTTLDFTVGIIGAGAMGSSIARGLLSSASLSASNIGLADTNDAQCAALTEEGFCTYNDAASLLAKGYDITVIAVKPQVLASVVEPLQDLLSDRLVVSIAAGVTLSKLESLLPHSRVVRVMPNLPIQVRSGATAIAAGSRALPQDVERVREVFAALGAACVMREDQLDVAGAVSGCGPAYFALIADQLTRAGVQAGLTTQDARSLVLYTMRGVADQLIGSNEHPRAYMDKVTSPGGTTAAALEAMEPQMFMACFDGVEAALDRTHELAG